MPRNRKGDPHVDAEKRMCAGSKRGAAAIKERFEAVLTRKRFSRELGISTKTLKRCETAKIVRPRMQQIGGVPTAIFDEADLALGREIVKLLRANPGTMSITAAADLARRTLGS